MKAPLLLHYCWCGSIMEQTGDYKHYFCLYHGDYIPTEEVENKIPMGPRDLEILIAQLSEGGEVA